MPAALCQFRFRSKREWTTTSKQLLTFGCGCEPWIDIREVCDRLRGLLRNKKMGIDPYAPPTTPVTVAVGDGPTSRGENLSALWVVRRFRL
jgi:hypothetical protein